MMSMSRDSLERGSPQGYKATQTRNRFMSHKLMDQWTIWFDTSAQDKHRDGRAATTSETRTSKLRKLLRKQRLPGGIFDPARFLPCRVARIGAFALSVCILLTKQQ
jgi:hypothetical protein